MQRKHVVDYLVYVAVRIVICIVQAIRIETGLGMARWLAWLFNDVIRMRAHVIDENLAHAFADLSARDRTALARRMWSICSSWPSKWPTSRARSTRRIGGNTSNCATWPRWCGSCWATGP